MVRNAASGKATQEPKSADFTFSGSPERAVESLKTHGFLVIPPEQSPQLVMELECLNADLGKKRIYEKLVFTCFDSEARERIHEITPFDTSLYLEKEDMLEWKQFSDILEARIFETIRGLGCFEKVVGCSGVTELILRVKSKTGDFTPLHRDSGHYVKQGSIIDHFAERKKGICALDSQEDCSEFCPYWTAFVFVEDLRANGSKLRLIPGSHLDCMKDSFDSAKLPGKQVSSRLFSICSKLKNSGNPEVLVQRGTIIIFNFNLLHDATKHKMSDQFDKLGAKTFRVSMDTRFAGFLRRSHDEVSTENEELELKAKNDAIVTIFTSAAQELFNFANAMFGESVVSFDPKSISQTYADGVMIMFLVDVIISNLIGTSIRARSFTNPQESQKLIGSGLKCLRAMIRLIYGSLSSTLLNWTQPSSDDKCESNFLDHLHFLNMRSNTLQENQIKASERRTHILLLDTNRECSFDDISNSALDRCYEGKMKAYNRKSKYGSDLEAFTKFWIFSMLAFDADVTLQSCDNLSFGFFETNIKVLARMRRNEYAEAIHSIPSSENQSKIVELVTHLLFAFSGWGRVRLQGRYFSEEIGLLWKMVYTSIRFNVDALCEVYWAFLLLDERKSADDVLRRILTLKKDYPRKFPQADASSERASFRAVLDLKGSDQANLLGSLWHQHWTCLLLKLEVPVLSIDDSSEVPKKYRGLLSFWIKSTNQIDLDSKLLSKDQSKSVNTELTNAKSQDILLVAGGEASLKTNDIGRCTTGRALRNLTSAKNRKLVQTLDDTNVVQKNVTAFDEDSIAGIIEMQSQRTLEVLQSAQKSFCDSVSGMLDSFKPGTVTHERHAEDLSTLVESIAIQQKACAASLASMNTQLSDIRTNLKDLKAEISSLRSLSSESSEQIISQCKKELQVASRRKLKTSESEASGTKKKYAYLTLELQWLSEHFMFLEALPKFPFSDEVVLLQEFLKFVRTLLESNGKLGFKKDVSESLLVELRKIHELTLVDANDEENQRRTKRLLLSKLQKDLASQRTTQRSSILNKAKGVLSNHQQMKTGTLADRLKFIEELRSQDIHKELRSRLFDASIKSTFKDQRLSTGMQAMVFTALIASMSEDPTVSNRVITCGNNVQVFEEILTTSDQTACLSSERLPPGVREISNSGKRSHPIVIEGARSEKRHRLSDAAVEGQCASMESEDDSVIEISFN